MFYQVQLILLATLSMAAAINVPGTFSRPKRSAIDNTVATTIPTSFDFRDYGKVTPVKNQGQCGSAWAHAAIASIESQYLLRKNQTLDLSEQTLLNCEYRSELCYSGDIIQPSFEYARDIGLPLESCAPYVTGADGMVDIGAGCEACTEQRYKIAGFRQYGQVKNGNTITYTEDQIAADLYNYGPAAAVLYLPPRNNGTTDFYDNVNHLIAGYTGGVMDSVPNPKCASMIVVLLVGYTPDYWIAKASLGPNWGENGYMRFRKGTNFCSMTRRVIGVYLDTPVLPPTTTTTTPKPTPPTTTTTAAPSGWTEWAALSCTANCGQCGRVVMKRVCRGGACPGEDTMTSTTKCGAATLCSFGLGLPSCCEPAKRAIVNGAIGCA